MNDYVLILDAYHFNESDYFRKRALALFQVGVILYRVKNYSEALKYLLIACQDLDGK